MVFTPDLKTSLRSGLVIPGAWELQPQVPTGLEESRDLAEVTDRLRSHYGASRLKSQHRAGSHAGHRKPTSDPQKRPEI